MGNNARTFREWLTEDHAVAYLKRAGFESRRNRSWRSPAGCKHLTDKERRTIIYLVRECGFDGLLTDAQHAERKRGSPNCELEKRIPNPQEPGRGF